VNVTAPGIYYVTATDAKGCEGLADFNVASPLVLTVAATDITCSYYPNGGAVHADVLGGQTPYAYFWSNGSSTASITEVSADNYCVTVTGANGCSASACDVVDIPSPLQVSVVWLTPACNGSNGSATVQASGGTPPYTHLWSPGGLTGAAQTGLAPGTYYVCTFDANGCQLDFDVVIPAVDALDVSLSVTSATCVGIDNGTATVVVNPPGNYIYTWNVPGVGNTPQITGLAASTFVAVTVSDPASGCTGTASGTVGAHNNIKLDLTTEDIPCLGGTGSASVVASNGTPDYVYTWYNGLNTVIGNEASITGLGPGAYLVSVVDAAGCMAQTVANIGIISAPNAVIDGGHVIVCGDSASTVQFINMSTDPYNAITQIIWTVTSPSLGTQVIEQQNEVVFNLPVGEVMHVQLVAISATACTDTATMLYKVPGFPQITLVMDSLSLDCNGGPIGINVIGGQPGYTYVWNPAVIFNPDPLHVLVNPTEMTTYTLTVTDGGDCTATASITISPNTGDFNLTVGSDCVVTCDSIAVLSAWANGPATIVWTGPDGNVIPGNPITVVATYDTLFYSVTATALNGNCVRSAMVKVVRRGFDIEFDPAYMPNGCEGDSLPLGVLISPAVVGPFQYAWSVDAPASIIPTDAANPVLVAPPGTHNVTVIVRNDHCADTLVFPVEVKELLYLNEYVSADLCEGLVVSFFNGTSMDGLWDFGDMSPASSEANPVHTYDTAGLYMVTFTPNDLVCVVPWDSMINVQQFSLAAELTAEYLKCEDEAVIKFNAETQHTGALTWKWTFSNGTPSTSNEQNPTVTFDTEGTVVATLVVTDVNNCTATASVEVEVSIINDKVNDQTVICLGEEIELNPVGLDPLADYSWASSPNDPTLTDPSNPNPVVKPIQNTEYSVAISKGLCKVEYSVVVEVLPGPYLELEGDTIVCDTASIFIQPSSNGAAYAWSNTLDFNNVFSVEKDIWLKPVPNGMYYLRATDVNGCFKIDSVMLNLSMAAVKMEPTDMDICFGEQAALIVTNLDPSQTLTYEWTPKLPPFPNVLVSPTETTTYTVVATNEYGCKDTLSFVVNVSVIGVTAQVVGADTVTVAGEKVTLLGTTSGNGNIINIEWTPSRTLTSPFTLETEAMPDQDEIYTITVTDDNGCTASAQVPVYFRQSPCTHPFIFVPKAFTPNGDGKNDFFRLRGEGITELTFIVWSRWGEIVYETHDPSDQGWDGTFRGKPMTPDSFAWYAKCTCGNGEVYEGKGNVTLLK
jgi:gliding motility-associated-like protein